MRIDAKLHILFSGTNYDQACVRFAHSENRRMFLGELRLY